MRVEPSVESPAESPGGTLTITPACLQCGLCAHLCPASAVTVAGRVFSIGLNCLGCRDCLEACPVGAIRPAAAYL